MQLRGREILVLLLLTLMMLQLVLLSLRLEQSPDPSSVFEPVTDRARAVLLVLL